MNLVTHDIQRAKNHLDGAIDSYNFIKRTFYEHLDLIGERENDVLKKARESITYFENQLSETIKQNK